ADEGWRHRIIPSVRPCGRRREQFRCAHNTGIPLCGPNQRLFISTTPHYCLRP
ncbi:hypothetical protein FS749_010342, partial [Ceratobasidium sp. UAMH 11750]